jgi:hypothetical protein
MTSKFWQIIASVLLLLSEPALAQPDVRRGLSPHANIVRNAMPLMTPATVRSRLPLRFGNCISSTLFQTCSVH